MKKWNLYKIMSSFWVTVGGVYVYYKKHWMYSLSKDHLKHIHHVESAIHEMKIGSTPVKMFWKEKDTVFCAFIANICPENKRNSLQLKKTAKGKSFKGAE